MDADVQRHQKTADYVEHRYRYDEDATGQWYYGNGGWDHRCDTPGQHCETRLVRYVTTTEYQYGEWQDTP